MPVCGIYGCSNRPGIQKEFSYFKVPKILKYQGDATRELSEERRQSWKAAINRKDIVTEEKWDRTLVCSKHFVGGMILFYDILLRSAVHISFEMP